MWMSTTRQSTDTSNVETSMWFPLAEDDDEVRLGNITPSCSSGHQTPQTPTPQVYFPSPPSTLSQLSLVQDNCSTDTTGPQLPLILPNNIVEPMGTGEASRVTPPATVATTAPANGEIIRVDEHGTIRAPPPTTSNGRRPVLYSAIGSLENASLHSWNKRMLDTAAKKASPFVTMKKNQGMPSTSTLLPPNQWVPLNARASPHPQSLASVLAAAEAAKTVDGSLSESQEESKKASPRATTAITTSPDGFNETTTVDEPANAASSVTFQPEIHDSDNQANIDRRTTIDNTATNASAQQQQPILHSALRTSKAHHRARSDDPKPHQRSQSLWGMFGNSERHVTMEESPATPSKKRKKKKKKVVEMFRPSCDAYTPRINTDKRTIKYKPAQERRAIMGGGKSEDMGTLSRPNFRDALRRVAMIVHQHVVKIEHRVEDQGGLLNKGLFTAEMRDAFSEERFVTPRYKCTMVRVPMSRPGMVYGLRKIKARYEIPTESEIYEFAHRLFQKVQLSSECSIVGLIYVERLMEIAKVPLLADTWRPIFLCGLLLASKVWQDLSSWNIEFASVYPQFSLKAIHQLELQFLRMVKWDLYISSSLYAKYYFALRSLVEKRDFRQRYNRMVGGVGSVDVTEALKIQKRTELVKEEALLQLSRSM